MNWVCSKRKSHKKLEDSVSMVGYKSGPLLSTVSFETKSASEELTNYPTVVNTEENVPSSEAVASTSTGEMVVNYSRHPHPQAIKCVSVIVTSLLHLLSQTLSII